jgi:hypothetical protein
VNTAIKSGGNPPIQVYESYISGFRVKENASNEFELKKPLLSPRIKKKSDPHEVDALETLLMVVYAANRAEYARLFNKVITSGKPYAEHFTIFREDPPTDITTPEIRPDISSFRLGILDQRRDLFSLKEKEILLTWRKLVIQPKK